MAGIRSHRADTRLRSTLRSAACAAILIFAARGESQTQNIRVSSVSITDPEEVCIAINPTNPMEMAAGSNLRYFYRTTDGGTTWSQSQLPVGTWGDPCVIYDGNGTLFYAHLSNLPAPAYFIDRLIIHRSSNGGISWKDSVTLGFNPPHNQDKEWLAADMTNSPYRNNVYIAWTQFDHLDSQDPLDSSRILFSRSTDGGSHWSTPLRISEQAGDCVDGDSTVEGAVPAIGPNGEVYTSWSGPAGIMFDRSTDGGVSFGRDIFVTDQPGGWDFAVPGIYRCNGMPITACDVSASQFRGNIYVVWSDQRAGPDNTEIYFTRSTNRGDSWSPRKTINTDNSGRHQFFPWMTVDQSTGTIHVVYYDRRRTSGVATEVFLARSTDGGDTFTDEVISQSPFTPDASVFFGDYTGIAAMNRQVRPIWMRMDAKALSVWTALVHDTLKTDVQAENDVPSAFALEQNYPNPFNGSTMITYEVSGVGSQASVVSSPSSVAIRVKLGVYDILGREVAVLVDESKVQGRYVASFDAAGLASGVYVYRLQSAGAVRSRTMVLLR
jgi:photosystem II stability/assembly factor-like uncharacterized protein